MRRLTCLDGLRGVLALYVMLSHILPFAILPSWLAGPFAHGGAGVDMFFILSGLVILCSLQAFAGHPGGFLIARASRIFPVYLLALALALALRPWPHGIAAMPWIGPDDLARVQVSDGWPEQTGLEIAAHALMIHGLFPDGFAPHVWVRFLGAAWSLSTEWQFYVLALALALCPLAPRRMALAFLALGGAGLLWRWAGPEAWQFSRAFLPNKAAYFALGIASAVVMQEGRAALRLYGAVLAGSLALCFAQGGMGGGVGKLAAPLAWTLVLAAQCGRLPPLAAPLRHPALLWLGAISYPLYIVHEPIHKLLSIPLAAWAGGNATWFTAAWLPGATLLPILTAWGLHHALELPAQRWGRARAVPSRLTRASI